MKLKTLLLLVTVFFTVMYSCSNPNPAGDTPSGTAAGATPEDAKKAVGERIRAMYKWYGDHHAEARAFDLLKEVPNSQEPDDYTVDLAEAEKELDYLRKSGFFSEKYLTARKTFYQEKEKSYREKTASFPDGFEADPFSHAQDGDGTVKLMAAHDWKVEVNGKTATGDSGPIGETSGVKLTLEEENGNWMISKVE